MLVQTLQKNRELVGHHAAPTAFATATHDAEASPSAAAPSSAGQTCATHCANAPSCKRNISMLALQAPRFAGSETRGKKATGHIDIGYENQPPAHEHASPTRPLTPARLDF